jgi:pimeloyl-ACP methyl ester carboxylesterase
MKTVQSADGTTIAFDRSGHGPALVLVTGAFTDRSSTKALAARLAPDFTVYEYDRRGRGDSADQPDYAIEREVDDLAAVIGAAGGSAFVFGHSSGAALALEAAARAVPVRKLAVYEPPYTTGPTDELADQFAALAASGREGEAAERWLTMMGTPAPVLEQMKAGPYWARMCGFAHTLPYEIRLCNNGVMPRDRLASITVPTLALAGGASDRWAGEVAQAIAATIPGADHRVLEGQGHGAADDAIVPILTEFFA